MPDWMQKFNGIKTLLGVLAAIAAAGAWMVDTAVWAADTRYMLKGEASSVVTQVRLDSMQQSVQDLQIQQGYEKDPERKEMLEAMIKIKQTQIDNLIQNLQVK